MKCEVCGKPLEEVRIIEGFLPTAAELCDAPFCETVWRARFRTGPACYVCGGELKPGQTVLFFGKAAELYCGDGCAQAWFGRDWERCVRRARLGRRGERVEVERRVSAGGEAEAQRCVDRNPPRQSRGGPVFLKALLGALRRWWLGRRLRAAQTHMARAIRRGQIERPDARAEVVEQFIKSFPGVCPICSFHRYGFVHGYETDPQPKPHDCCEAQ